MEIIKLGATLRGESGKGVSRRLRMRSLIPAVLYGRKTEPMMLTVNASQLKKLLAGKEESVIINLIIENGKKTELFTVIKDLQISPVNKQFLHIDFCEIDMKQSITLDIPIHFKGEASGVENGGELHHVKRDLKISCLPTVMPEYIEVDVSNLGIGDTITLQDLSFVEGITVLDPADTVIASVTALKTPIKTEREEEKELLPGES